MKTTFLYTGLFFLIIAGMNSCKKTNLDLDPYNTLPTDQAFNNANDFLNATRGVYRGFLTSGSYAGGEWVTMPDLIADNLSRVAAGRGTGATYYLWQYTSEGTSGLFSNGYSIIRRANGILENIGKLPAGTDRDNFEAEALAVRAMVHFDIVRVYSKIYSNSNPASDLGMPYITGTDFTLKPSRPSLQVTYDKILADLLAAYPKVRLTNRDASLNSIRIGKAAVAALLSRVYLHMADWANTVKWADSSLKYNSSLGSLTSFPGIWTDDNETGVLFKIRMTEKDNITLGVQYEQLTSSGYRSEFVPAHELFTQYASNDIRKSAYFETSNYLGVPYNHVIKYAKRLTGRLNIVDCKMIRVAEVLLTRAEAKYKLNDEAGALSDINTLMNSRYNGFTNLNISGQVLLDEIYKQRRLELFGEGDRLFFLKRMNLPVVRAGLGDQANGAGATPPSTALTLPVGSNKFQLPIPQSEINANPNMQPNP
jgi:starch-binding outer membrane protein, SusD/RagB family